MTKCISEMVVCLNLGRSPAAINGSGVVVQGHLSVVKVEIFVQNLAEWQRVIEFLWEMLDPWK